MPDAVILRNTSGAGEEVTERQKLAHYETMASRKDRSIEPSTSRLVKRKCTSANRVIVDLIETGLKARKREQRAFFELAERLAQSDVEK